MPTEYRVHSGVFLLRRLVERSRMRVLLILACFAFGPAACTAYDNGMHSDQPNRVAVPANNNGNGGGGGGMM